MNASIDIHRDKRKTLVLAAEEVMKDAVGKVNKAQLSHLVSVCNDAACAEEITLYIRYQSSRSKGSGTIWDTNHAEKVIEAADKAMADLPSDDAKVAAWRLYAVYLARAFTYQDAVVKASVANRQGGRR
jgi:hypothetical protein